MARHAAAGQHRRARQPRLCDLHLRIDRPPQGRDDPAPWRHQPRRGAAHPPAARSRRPHPAVRLDQLRCRRMGPADGLARRRRPRPRRPARPHAGRAAARADHPPAHHHRAAAALGARRPAVRRTLLPDHPDRRRRGLRGRAAAAMARRPHRAQRLWADRGQRVHHPVRLPLRRAPAADRPPAPQHPHPCAGRAARAGADRRCRRAVHRRRRPGARLSRPPRPHRRALRARPVRPRRAALPHRRPGALARRWRARLPRPPRYPGEDPRLPHRARRDRSHPAGTTRHRARRRHRPRRCRRQTPRRLSGRTQRSRLQCRRAAPKAAAHPARLHGARRLRQPRPPAAHPQRQARPLRPPASRVECRRPLPRTPQPNRDNPRRPLRRTPRQQPRRHQR